MWPKSKLGSLAIVFAILSVGVSAEARLRVSAGLGFGSTSTQNEASVSEGPLTQMYNLEYMSHSKMVIGAEHLRSLNLSPMGTGISFTGLFARYYLNSAPSAYATPNEVRPGEIIVRDIAYFIGTGAGLAQSSLLPGLDGLSTNAAGVYLSPRGGAEFQLTRDFGVRGELIIGMTVFGKGTISSFSLLGSVYYGF